MDYDSFFKDIADWTKQVNVQAASLGLGSEAFWHWVADSTGAIENKYNAHPLVVKQLVMLFEYVEEVYHKQKEVRA